MQGKQLRLLENDLWKAADQLRANSKLTASEYSMPVLGLIFLRHAFNRFQKALVEVEAALPVNPQRGRRAMTKQDFLERNALFLPEMARFDYLTALPERADIGEAIDNAMKAIEDEHDNLRGILPRNYSIFSKELLRELINIFNKEALQKAEGDMFGKIYEFFLNKFAESTEKEIHQVELFVPDCILKIYVEIIEPNYGIVFDPICGTARTLVSTGKYLHEKGLRPAEKVTFYGQEKTETNTRLAKMNLAVHGLEGKIQEGNTFYEDKHNLAGKADFVMANPPFNVDGVDKGKDFVKKDTRLQLGGTVNLPNNDNANYLWIQYFYNYLTATGRAGFVMASSASDAGHSEKDIREKLVKTGAVDVMIAIGNNFFYTRSLPCTLWFYDRAKEQDAERSTKTLMLDARKIYRKVTSKVNDFSPEQLANLLCIVQLYRGNTKKFHDTVREYRETSLRLAREAAEAVGTLREEWDALVSVLRTFATAFVQENPAAQTFFDALSPQDEAALREEQERFVRLASSVSASLEDIAHAAKALRKPQDKLIKHLLDAIAAATKEHGLNKNAAWKALATKDKLDRLRAVQAELSGNPDEEDPGLLHETEYFQKQAHWLESRFPAGTYRDVEGLCKVVTQAEIATKDYSLSPGRYVGVDTATDDDFDYEERLREIHLELAGLNDEAAALAQMIQTNVKEVVV